LAGGGALHGEADARRGGGGEGDGFEAAGVVEEFAAIDHPAEQAVGEEDGDDLLEVVGGGGNDAAGEGGDELMVCRWSGEHGKRL